MVPSPFRRLAARLSRLAAALVVAFAVAPVALARAETAAEKAITAWAEALRATGAEVRWTSLAAAPEGERVELAGLVVASGSGETAKRLEVPSLVLVGFAERPDGGFAATAIEMPQARLTGRADGEDMAVEVAGLAIAEVLAPRPEAPSIDIARPFSTLVGVSRLVDGWSVARLSLASFTLRSGAPGSRERTEASLTGFELAGLREARLDRFRLGSLALDVANAEGDARLAAAAVEIDDLDVAAWRGLYLDDGALPAEGWRRTLGRAATGRVSLDAGGSKLSIERSRFAARHVRRPPEPLAAIMDRFAAAPETVTPADALRLTLESFLAGRSDGWSIEGLHVTGPTLDHADVARVAFGTFDADRLTEASLEGLEVVGRHSTTKLAAARLADLRLPDADDLRRAVPAVLAGAEIDPSSLMPTVGSIDVERLEIREPGIPPLSLERLRLDFAHHVRAIPTAVSIVLDRFVLPAGLADAAGRKTLDGLGLDRFDFSAALRLAWDEPSRDLRIERLALSVADAGSIEASARFTGVPRTVFEKPEYLPLALTGIKLAEASASLTDASLLDRTIALIARDTATRPEVVRRRLAKEAAAAFDGLRDKAAKRRFAEAVRRFVEKPSPTTLTLRPKQPLSVTEILALSQDPLRLVERLDTTIVSGR